MLTVGEILQDSLQRSGGVDDVWEELQQRCKPCLRRGSPPFTTSHRSNVWHRLYEAPLIRQGTHKGQEKASRPSPVYATGNHMLCIP